MTARATILSIAVAPGGDTLSATRAGGRRTCIADGTGVHAYAVNQVLRQMITRTQSLGRALHTTR